MPRTTRASAARTTADFAVDQQQLSSPPVTPAPTKQKKGQANVKARRFTGNDKNASKSDEKSRLKRKAIKQEEGDVNDLPHNLQGLGNAQLPSPEVDGEEAATPPKKRTKRSPKKQESKEPVKMEEIEDASEKTKAPRTPKKANYGLTPGVSPYPDYARPTNEECYEVTRLLEKVHGKVVAPKAIPPPSLDVAGCGEVPSVLDALVRTRLSANTTNKNSSTAFQGLVSRFGTLKEGVGKGSVDWDAVRRAPQKEVFKAIQRGGLADRKSKDIQAILQMAYEENQERSTALKNTSQGPAGATNEEDGEKQAEIKKAEHNIISLDHLHLLSTNDAINRMLEFPGIGPKTASCVALFCLQRPSFAVDTHVFRLCQYLGWVPKSAKKGQPKVDRNTTYSHCDVRIPDDLKYPLHQLLIRHGKVCPRCRAVTGQTSANWADGCPIEHLVKRHGAKKGGISVQDRKKAQKAAGLTDEEADMVPDEGVDEESELSEEEAET